MSNRCELLDNLTNISEECSDIELDATDSELSSASSDYIQSETLNSSDTEDSDEEPINMDESFINTLRTSCSVLNRSDSDEDTETAADGTVWSKLKEGGIRRRLPFTYVFKGVKGPTEYAKKNIIADNLISAFSLVIDTYIIKHIKTCTEEEGRRILRSDWTTSLSELNAFIGILYARGAYEAKNLKLSYLWSAKWGPDYFKKTMAREKFKQILRFIRFDRRMERSRRLQTNKFALVSEIWNKFIKNSQACYQPGQNITVDEQLFPSKARCRFTQYMPNKPNKFGIKFWLASDVSSKYILNGFPYLGKEEPRPTSIALSEHVVMKLVKPYTSSGRNITADNYFTSISLAVKLLAKKTTLVGTIRGNKRELPKAAKTRKDDMPRFSSLLYKNNNCVLTVYKSKPNKKVAVLSSMHKIVKLDMSNKKMVPETIQFYNSTKYGVDITDQMARKYTVKASSRRWPLQVFFNILDLAAINAWILYRETTGIQITRKEFLFQLAEQLSNEYRVARQKNTSANEDNLKSTAISPSHSIKRKICQVRLCNNNKTNIICKKCNKYVCGSCTHTKISTSICIKCIKN